MDKAFEAGVDDAKGRKSIFLPWRGFEGSDSSLVVQPWTEEIASKYHPVWDGLSQGAKKLHSRNVHQILGYNGGRPSSLVICWTKDGCETHSARSSKTGGTGTAISLANDYAKIPVFNLQRKDALERLDDYITKIEAGLT